MQAPIVLTHLITAVIFKKSSSLELSLYYLTSQVIRLLFLCNVNKMTWMDCPDTLQGQLLSFCNSETHWHLQSATMTDEPSGDRALLPCSHNLTDDMNITR